MKVNTNIRCILRVLFTLIVFTSFNEEINAQLKPRDFVLYAYDTTLIGSSATITGGLVGAKKLVRTTGNVTFNNLSIHSSDKISLWNSNIVGGNISAGYSSLSPGPAISIGSSTSVNNIDSKGSVSITGGTVLGKVTLPSPPPTYTYSGPAPGGGPVVFGTPSTPLIPALDLPNPSTIPAPPPGYVVQSYTGSKDLGPGWYGDITYGGNKTLTLTMPGVYVFNSFHWSGNINKLIFNFTSSADNYTIYVRDVADFGKISASLSGDAAGSAARISFEIQGFNNAFVIANGSSGGGSKWLGSIYTPNGSINIGSGTGTGTAFLKGTFASRKGITIQSGVTVEYSAPCLTEKFVDAGKDRPLAFTTKDSLLATSTAPGTTTFSWQAINGGTILSGANNAKVYISSAGTYIVTGSLAGGCSTKDTVVIAAKVPDLIGAELLSIFINRNSPNLSLTPFFGIQNGYVLIDVIVNTGYYTDVLNTLQVDSRYGLRPPYYPDDLNFHNGESDLMITGQFPIDHLENLDNFNIDAGVKKINFIRTYYNPVSNSGFVTTAGDTTIRTYLVRSGYNVSGNGIKIGVISDSYGTIHGNTVYPDQTLTTNDVDRDIARGELPSNVTVLKDFPIQRFDEGRAMMGIIHDIAPGAQLYFRTGFFTNYDFAQGIQELADAGCKIIVDDMTYFNEPFLKDGIVAKTVDKVVAEKNVVYFTSAGNFSAQSYEKDFKGINATDIGFPTGVKAHDFGGGDRFQKIKLTPGNYVFVLQWLDGFHSNNEGETINDVDFYLTKNTDGTGLIGFNRINGPVIGNNIGNDPIEFIPITVVGSSPTDVTPQEYNVLIINNTTTSAPERVKYIAFKRSAGASIEFVDVVGGSNSTIVGQANAAGAITVGAASFDKAPPFLAPPQIETFSSRGGTKVWLNSTTSVIRQKPDITATDNVNVTVNLGPDYPTSSTDGFSNFKGTSAAAPHAAAAAALIIEARQKYLGQSLVLPSTIRALMDTSATEMETPNFDTISGFGLINIDMTLRTFAAPTPYIDKLIVPVTIPQTIPGDVAFTVTIKGDNFRPNTVVWFGDSPLPAGDYQILDTINGIATAKIPLFAGNPPVRMYTPPYPNTNGLDGGFSNSRYFYDKRVVVTAVSYTKKYGQPMPPVLDTIIRINDTLLQDSRYTLAELGFDKDSLHITTDATANSEIGQYDIIVNRNFDPNNTTDQDLLKKFTYKFINGVINIERYPVTVIADNISFVYGHEIPKITYKYYDSVGGGIVQITDPYYLHLLDSSHHSSLPDNVLGVINGFQSSGLTNTDIQNMSTMSSFQAIRNSRKFKNINGELIPITGNAGFNVRYVVDVAAQSIKDFQTATTDDDLLRIPYPGVHARAMLKATSLVAGTAKSGLTVSTLTKITNGELLAVVNSDVGGLVPIVNGDLLQVVNGVILQETNTPGELIPVVNGELVQLVNGQWVYEATGLPVSNVDLVQVVNNDLVQIVNGDLQPLVNTELVLIVNALGAGVVNSDLQPIVNNAGENVGAAIIVKMQNNDLVQVVNTNLQLVVNSELVPVVNTDLQQVVNGELLNVVNGDLQPLVNVDLVQVVNNDLVPLVNGDLVALVNTELQQVVNLQIVNGELMQVVNTDLLPIVNSYGAGTGNNEKAGVIIDSDDIDVQNGIIGGMFSTNTLTGLDVGTQKIISATLPNRNFKVSYGLGTAEILTDVCLQIHTPFKNFGNTTKKPTSLWLNVVTKVSGQLTEVGDYLLFKRVSTTFNFIQSDPTITDFPIPDGKIIAVTPLDGVTYPRTYFDFSTHTWTTEVKPNFTSTSDIFVTGEFISASDGFQKLDGNTNTVVVGKFYCTKPFSDQWAHAIAAYQLQQSPPSPPYEYVTVNYPGMADYTNEANKKGIVPINGTYRAATPLPILSYLVQGVSGGGGNNYTGSKSSYQAFTACDPDETVTQRSSITSVIAEERAMPLPSAVLITPNPAANQFNLVFVPSQTGISKVEIFTMNGSKIMEADYGVCEAGNRYSKTINVSKLVNGMYLVRVSNGGTVTNKKIVIAR